MLFFYSFYIKKANKKYYYVRWDTDFITKQRPKCEMPFFIKKIIYLVKHEECSIFNVSTVFNKQNLKIPILK